MTVSADDVSAEILVTTVADVLIVQLGVTGIVVEKLRAQDVTVPLPTVIVPLESVPDTEGDVPQDPMLGVPKEPWGE